MPAVYVHIHIAKNAGQTFNAILHRLFGPRLIYAPEARPGHILTETEKRQLLNQTPGARCVTGHAFRYPAPAGGTYRYLAWLRHPVARLVSQYAYERQRQAQNPGHSSHRPLGEWIEARLAEDNALSNYQTYHLLGLRSPAEFEPEAALARAQQLLDEFFFVGLAEQFDDALLLLGRRMRLPLYALCYRRINATNSQERFSPSAAERDRLLELNQVDLQLYEYGRRKFEAALAEVPAATLAAGREKLAQFNQKGPAALPVWYKIGRRLAGTLAA